jgi:hypothetical protein
MCRVLRVSAGGYYDWRGRPQSIKAQRREALVVAIKAVHAEVKARYGSPRIHAELVARGEPCTVNTVARLMREHGIVTVGEKPWRGSAEERGARTSEVTARSPRRRWPAPAGRAAYRGGGGRRAGDSSPSPSP